MSPDIERKKILVVDDELDMRIFLCNLLGNCGYHPIGASNQIDGLQKAKEEKPALIILDVMMPKEEGIRMYRQLRADKNLKQVPVIMVSTIDKKTFSRCQKFQSTPSDSGIPEPGAFIEKPIETEELVMQIRELMSASDSAAAMDDD